MALEAPPERGALWLDNWILSSTIASVISEHVNYPARHLLNPHRSDTYQSTNASAGQRVVFDLGTPKLPTCFGLIGANFATPGAFVHLYGASDAGLTTDGLVWTFPLYAQDPTGKTLTWYPGTTPSGGTVGARRFWAVWLIESALGPYATPEDFFEFGVVWLGEYIPIRPWASTRIRAKDPSIRTYSYGRAPWSDPLTPYREADVTLGGLTAAQGYELEAKIRAQGTKHAILDVHAFSTDPILKRGGALYGMFPEDPVDFSLSTPDENPLDFAFEETSG